jgi:hypothetical protein
MTQSTPEDLCRVSRGLGREQEEDVRPPQYPPEVPLLVAQMLTVLQGHHFRLYKNLKHFGPYSESCSNLRTL